jgi:uncharacterized membrane protein YedE/YeeE
MESVLASLWGIITFAGFVDSLLISKADDYVSKFKESVGEDERLLGRRWTRAVRGIPMAVLAAVVVLAVVAPMAVDASTMDLCLLGLGVLAQVGFTSAVRYLVPTVPGSIPDITPARGMEWQQLRSQHGTQQTAVRFINATGVILELHWIDWNGQLQQYGTIEPGREWVQITYLGHPFLLRTAEGRDVAVVAPLPRPGIARISSTCLPSGPGASAH